MLPYFFSLNELEFKELPQPSKEHQQNAEATIIPFSGKPDLVIQ